ncbi:unnamed protein product, partial [Closterium sp. NIES-54]
PASVDRVTSDTSADKLSSRAGPAPSGVSQVDPVEPVEVAVVSGAARGAEPAGAGPGGAEPGVTESEGAEPKGAEPGVTESEGAEPRGAEPERVERGGAEPERAKSGDPLGVPSRREPLSPQRLREWYARRCSRAAGATVPAAGGAAGAGAAGAAGPGGTGAGGTGAVGGPAGARAAGGAGAAGPRGARTGGTGAAGAGGAERVGAVGAGAVASGGATGARAAGGTGAGGAAGVVAGDLRAEGTGAVSAVSGGATRPRLYFVPLLQHVLGLPPSTGPTPPLQSPPPVQSQSQLQPASPQPGPSPYSGPTRGLTERREPEFHPASPESRLASPESRPESPVHTVCTGRRVPRQRPPPVPGTHSITLHPSNALQRSTDASALLAELVDIAAASRLDYAASLVAESESTSVCPPPVEGECALGTDVLENRQEEFECFVAALPHLWQTAMDTEMASWKSTGTYVDKVSPPGANIVSGMWIFRVKRPPGSPPVFKARYVARGFSQRQGVHFFHAFSPTPKMTTLRAHHEWHDTLRTTLAALGFAPSTADPSLFLRTDTTLPPFYVLVYVDDLVLATADTEALAHVKSELQKRHKCTDLGELTGYLVLRITRDKAQRTITLTQSHMVQQVLQCSGFTYSSPQSTPLPTGHSLSAPPLDESVEPSGPSSFEAEIYAGAMAAQKLRWLTYLLTDTGEPPRSPPLLYVDNKAMIALCQEHRLEHRTKHIALRYFLARDLQKPGQLCLAYVASRANTADVFTKALQPCDHQRFCTVLGLVPTMPHLLTS